LAKGPCPLRWGERPRLPTTPKNEKKSRTTEVERKRRKGLNKYRKTLTLRVGRERNSQDLKCRVGVHMSRVQFLRRIRQEGNKALGGSSVLRRDFG